MKHFVIWDAVSMAWSEVGLAAEDYPRIAEKLRATYASWDEVNDVVVGDVVGSFALESSLLPLVAVPIIGLFLVSPFPDWGYEEVYLKDRMARWYKVPRWRHYLNPLRLLGFPLAMLLSIGVRRKLKAAFHSCRPNNSSKPTPLRGAA